MRPEKGFSIFFASLRVCQGHWVDSRKHSHRGESQTNDSKNVSVWEANQCRAHNSEIISNLVRTNTARGERGGGEREKTSNT
jgi:hypothetical protein